MKKAGRKSKENYSREDFKKDGGRKSTGKGEGSRGERAASKKEVGTGGKGQKGTMEGQDQERASKRTKDGGSCGGEHGNQSISLRNPLRGEWEKSKRGGTRPEKFFLGWGRKKRRGDRGGTKEELFTPLGR